MAGARKRSKGEEMSPTFRRGRPMDYIGLSARLSIVARS